MRCHLAAPVALAFAVAVLRAQAPVTFESLLGELVDLDRLTRLPDPDYRTVQFSSTDRRTKSPDEPGWFANADGFGQEPIPGFEQVLKAPGADAVGEYLICDVDGPGAIVRGWSAGMDGVLRVWLDGSDKPLFEGKGYDFLARRSSKLIDGFAQLPEATRRLLQQEDADYLPIPFAQHLRVTWTGSMQQLHFYHLQVRRYAKGAKVVTMTAADRRVDVGAVIAAAEPRVDPDAVHPANPSATGLKKFEIAPGDAWQTELTATELRAFEFELELQSPDLGTALRGVLLRVACDGAPQPQVDTALGDFFASFADPSPQKSLPLEVAANGTFRSHWPMPFRKSLRFTLANHTALTVRGELSTLDRVLAGSDDRFLYFHALWRVDHDLDAQAGKAPIDLPFLTAIGQGRFVGCAVNIVNPPMSPSWQSNWWGEGDEKITVDGARAALGTGSEDYFNYSWSHWRHFALPFCGQPLSSGPGNCGYATNYRWQIVDDLPFAQSFAMAMELWTHKPVRPLSYARLVCFYARPGVLTDHRAVQPGECVLPKLPPWTDADFPADRATTPLSWLALDVYHASAGNVAKAPTRWTRSGAILEWQAPAGARLDLPFAIAKDGNYRLRLCCRQRPDAPAIRLLVDDKPQRAGDRDEVSLQCVHGERYEDVLLDRLELAVGQHTLSLVCPDGGAVGLDLLGVEPGEPAPKQIPGAVEGELMELVASSPGLDVEVQGMGSNDWSGMHQRWIKATKPGDFAAFRVVAPKAGRYRVTLRLTQSWDYGVVRVDWNGSEAAKDVDLWCGPEQRLSVKELDLGERDLSQPCELKLTVTGHAPGNAAPNFYCGLDCVVLTAK
jgi:hypothetical protein